nr:DUF5631 domain-containing protein [Mycobacterium shinjukuense]
MIDQAGSGHVLPGGRRPGPTLAEAVRRRDGLPRIAHAVAVAATRNYGVPDNEADLLHHKATQIRQSVLATYPNHDVAGLATAGVATERG